MPPPRDSEIPDLTEEVQRMLTEMGIKTVSNEQAEYGIEQTHVEMFKVRLSIENLLRQYYSENGLDHTRNAVSRMLNELFIREQISGQLHRSLREVISICNYAVHGKSLSKEQIKFVKTSAPALITALKNALSIS